MPKKLFQSMTRNLEGIFKKGEDDVHMMRGKRRGVSTIWLQLNSGEKDSLASSISQIAGWRGCPWRGTAWYMVIRYQVEWKECLHRAWSGIGCGSWRAEKRKSAYVCVGELGDDLEWKVKTDQGEKGITQEGGWQNRRTGYMQQRDWSNN